MKGMRTINPLTSDTSQLGPGINVTLTLLMFGETRDNKEAICYFAAGQDMMFPGLVWILGFWLRLDFVSTAIFSMTTA